MIDVDRKDLIVASSASRSRTRLPSSATIRIRFNIPEVATVVTAIVRLLSLPSDRLSRYSNKHVYISSALVSQPEIFDAIKRVTNTIDADWKISHSIANDRVNEGKKKLAEGIPMAPDDLVHGYDTKAGFGADYEAVDNEVLGQIKSIEKFFRKVPE